MGLFSKKLQVIKFEQNLCNADINDNKVLFVRVNDLVKDKDAMFEVPFTHNGLLIKGGGDCRLYKSGTYDVFDDKKEIKKWKQGISVEVVYIPKETSVLIRWGTPDKVLYRDPIAQKVVEVGARGQFGISIANPEQFFRKVVGARKEFDLRDFSNRFGAAVVSEYSDVFLNVVTKNDISYDLFDTNKKSIGVKVGEALKDKFLADWGIILVDFIIEQFFISEEDKAKVEVFLADEVAERKAKERKEEEKKDLREYLAELERLDDKQWERDKYLHELEQKDRAAYYEVLKVIGQKDAAKKGGNFCPKCGHSVESTEAFCSHCGNKMAKAKTVCPKCGKVAEGDARFCGGCGHKF